MNGRVPTSMTLTIVSIAAVVGSLFAYAAYFDYKRRNDPSVRKKIRSQRKKIQQRQEKENGREKDKKFADLYHLPDQLAQAFRNATEKEVLPEDPAVQHQFFMHNLEKAEKVATDGPQAYLEAATYFYRALRSYSSKEELLHVYSRTIPRPIYMIILQMHNLSVSERTSAEEKDEESNTDGTEGTQSASVPPEASTQDV